MPGQGQMPGNGQMPGQGQMDGANHLSVLQQGQSDEHGSSGTSGMKGSSPSGASAPETVMAEEVKTDPPPRHPEGIIKAIREHSSGDHTATRSARCAITTPRSRRRRCTAMKFR